MYENACNKLDRFIPIPSYFIKDNLCIVMISANGAEKIITSIDLYLSNMTKVELKQINVGMHLNDLENEISKNNVRSKTLFKALDYGKYGVGYQNYSGDSSEKQFVIWSTSAMRNEKENQ